MITLWRSVHARVAAAVAGLLALAAVIPVASVADPSLGTLNSELSAQQARAAGLSASISHLNGVIGALGSQITFVQSREASVRAELAQDQAKLAATTAALDHERTVLAILVARLGKARALLARQLVSSYESDHPDFVSIVLESHGFKDLLDKIQYLRSAEHEQNQLIAATRTAKARADSAAHRLAGLEATQREITAATASRERALQGMNLLLTSRQGALQKARAAQAAALAVARARGQALQGQISQVEAQQAAAERAAAANPSLPTPTVYGGSGASGGWVIPSAVVACESGGQNLTPNSAGASGYYQIIPSTWKQYGGSGPAAYLAPKSEQDAVAQRIWAGGSGSSNWDCANMLGIH
jgi:septal ring factor EnvC (AmiA/AmiB activator)